MPVGLIARSDQQHGKHINESENTLGIANAMTSPHKTFLVHLDAIAIVGADLLVTAADEREARKIAMAQFQLSDNANESEQVRAERQWAAQLAWVADCLQGPPRFGYAEEAAAEGQES